MNILNLGLTLIALGIAVAGLSTFDCFVPSFCISNSLSVYLLGAGSLIGLMGLGLVFMSAVKGINSLAKHTYEKTLTYIQRKSHYEISVEQATRSNLNDICTLGNALIGEHHASNNALLERYQKCDAIAWCIWKKREGKPKQLGGYFIIYPLNADATARIRERKVVNAKQLNTTDLTQSFSRASSLYVSMVAGSDKHLRPVALLALNREIINMAQRYKKIKYLFAKPATLDGKRLLDKHAFEALGKGTEIFAISISRLLSPKHTE